MNYPIEGDAPADIPKPTRAKLFLVAAGIGAVLTVGGLLGHSKKSDAVATTEYDEDYEDNVVIPSIDTDMNDDDEYDEAVEISEMDNIDSNDFDDDVEVADIDEDLSSAPTKSFARNVASIFSSIWSSISLDKLLKDLGSNPKEFKQLMNLSDNEYKVLSDHIAQDDIDGAIKSISHKASNSELKDFKKFLKAYSAEMKTRENRKLDFNEFLKASQVSPKDFQKAHDLSAAEYQQLVKLCSEGRTPEALNMVKSKSDAKIFKAFHSAVLNYMKNGSAYFLALASEMNLFNGSAASAVGFMDKSVLFKANFDMDALLKELDVKPADFMKSFGLNSKQYQQFKTRVRAGQYDQALSMIESEMSGQEKRDFKNLMKEYAKHGASFVTATVSQPYSLRQFLKVENSTEAKFSKEYDLTKEEFDNLNSAIAAGNYKEAEKILIKKMDNKTTVKEFLSRVQSAKNYLQADLFQAHIIFYTAAAAVTEGERIVSFDNILSDLGISKQDFINQYKWNKNDYKNVNDLLSAGQYKEVNAILKDTMSKEHFKSLSKAISEAQKARSLIMDHIALDTIERI